MWRHPFSLLAIALVLGAYVFFGSGGAMRFPSLDDSGYSRHADLAAGFAKGHLYLAHDPDPRLAQLSNPWELKQREGIWYEWDVSYFNGRYYLYFSALPSLFVDLPYYAVVRRYPSDAFVTVVFSAWAFLAGVWFLWRAPRSFLPLPLWILLLGLGNVVPWCLTDPHVYEVTVACGMAMSAMCAVAMLAFVRAPTPLRAANLSLWLGLAVAARPNLGVLLFVAAFAVLVRTRALKTLVALVLPAAAIGAALIAYNVARFGQPFEFGVRYQLTQVSMLERRVCGLSSLPEVGRLLNHSLHYVFAAPIVRSTFPFLDLPHATLDPNVVWPSAYGFTEAVAGLAPLVPLSMIGTLLALLMLAGLGGGTREPTTQAAMLVLAGGWLVLFGLSACWWVVARYALDFMMLIVIGSIVCIEAGMPHLARLGVRLLPLRIAVVVLAAFSILAGFLLGFRGPGDAFSRAHPQTFQRVSGWFAR